MAAKSSTVRNKKKTTKNTRSNKKVITSRRSRLAGRPLAIVAAVLFGFIGMYLVVQSGALQPDEELLLDQPERGLVYEGKKIKTKGPCAGAFDVTTEEDVKQDGKDKPRCAHLDPSPPGLDIRERIKKVDQNLADLAAHDEKYKPAASDDTSGYEQPPMVDAETIGAGSMDGIGARDVPCFGTGVDGHRVWLLYIYPSGGTNRLADLRPGLRAIAKRMNSVFYNSGAESGNAHQVRFATNDGAAGCVARIVDVPMTPSIMDDTSAMRKSLIDRGFNVTGRKYLSWVDKKYVNSNGAIIKCGLGEMRIDDNPAQTNVNNTSVSFAWAWKGCWNYAEPHELLHTLGGVQGRYVNPTTGAVRAGAPYSTPGSHCYDDRDVMCYDDDGSGPVVVRNICTRAIDWWRLDCRHDTYYRGNSPASGYLSNHWNTANNQFLTR